jgi:hypothetical protein
VIRPKWPDGPFDEDTYPEEMTPDPEPLFVPASDLGRGEPLPSQTMRDYLRVKRKGAALPECKITGITCADNMDCRKCAFARGE